MCFSQVRKRTTPAIQTFLCTDITNPTAFQLTQLYSKNSNSLASPEKHQPSPLRPTLCQVSVTWAQAGTEQGALGLAAAKRQPSPTSWQVSASDALWLQMHPSTPNSAKGGSRLPRKGEALSCPCPQAQGPLGKGTARGRGSTPASGWPQAGQRRLTEKSPL